MVIKERVESILYNAAVLIGPEGEYIGSYRKVHLKGEEKLAFRNGYRFQVWDVEFREGPGRIGLLVGWCLLQLAWHKEFAAAMLLPLYYLTGATVTLFRRMARGEQFWAAHRTHFYQRATDNGFSVQRVVSEVFVLNAVLAALAIGSVTTSSSVVIGLLLLSGLFATSMLLYRFSRERS